MQTLQSWQVGAFTSQPFGGNPACIVGLERWFTPALGVNLRGHATLATSHAVSWNE